MFLAISDVQSKLATLKAKANHISQRKELRHTPTKKQIENDTLNCTDLSIEQISVILKAID